MSASKTQSERIKLAAIPCLLAGLYFALTSTEDSKPVKNVPARKSAEKSAAATSSSQEIAPEKAPRTRSLASLPLAHILEHDPFQMPDSMLPAPVNSKTAAAVSPQEEFLTDATETPTESRSAAAREVDESSREQQLSALRQRKVNLILHDARGPVAMIGKKLVRVGDTLEDNVRVVAIDQQGIVLELVSPQ